MKKLFYIKNISNFDYLLPDLTGDTLVVYSDILKIDTKFNKMKFSDYKLQYINLNVDNIIIVGMNRIRTDKDRQHNVFGFLYTYSNFINKFIIDEKPFNKEPWRLWYHHGFIERNWLNASNSFPIQLKYEKWFERDIEDCYISAKNMINFKQYVYSDLPLLSTQFIIYEPDNLFNEYYSDIKNIAFEKYETPGLIIQFMTKTINKHLSINIDYDSYLSNNIYKLPNVGLYRFIIEENKRRMDIYNTLIK